MDEGVRTGVFDGIRKHECAEAISIANIPIAL